MPKTRKKLDGNYHPSEDGEPQHADSDSSSGSYQKTKKNSKVMIRREQNRKRQQEYRKRIRSPDAAPDAVAKYNAG